jgi:hypothetical protein
MADFLIQVEVDVDGLASQAHSRGFTDISGSLKEIGADIHRMSTLLISSIKPDKPTPKELELGFRRWKQRRGRYTVLDQGHMRILE